MTTAIIGGSGFARLDTLTRIGEARPDTPYGQPSDAVIRGRLGDCDILFLPRHGAAHRIPPHKVNYRANLYALKHLGAARVVSLAAVGGIGADYAPGSVALVDQIIDYTWGRESTYFDGDTLQHAEFTEPFCPQMRRAALRSAAAAGVDLIDGGVYAVTQGPRLESAAEIKRLGRDGAHVVGMTAMPEAALARELGIGYLTLAMSVNYAAGISPRPIDQPTIDAAFATAGDKIKALLPALLAAVKDLDCAPPAPISP